MSLATDAVYNISSMFAVECKRAGGSSHGQQWLQYKENCHQYIMCEPRGAGKYVVHLLTCDKLFWNQKWHTCTSKKSGKCVVGPIVHHKSTIVNGGYILGTYFVMAVIHTIFIDRIVCQLYS